MNAIKWGIGSLVGLLLMMLQIGSASAATEVSAVQVGRIYHIDGEVLRYVSEENDWVAVVKDAPFGAEDTFFSGSQGMAELIAPNGTWTRIGNNTQIQFIALDTDLSEVDVVLGMARFYAKNSDTVIKASSPFGYVLADPDAVFDFYVSTDCVEVIAIKGKVSFVQSSTQARYSVVAGSPSLLANSHTVSMGDGSIDSTWDRWNAARETYWSAKMRARGRSAEYLPAGLTYESDVFDTYGAWEMVPYDGRACWFWRPTTIVASWSPYTVGVWTEWYGDQTWIPGEPFGYVTHHYGNWVYIGSHWYWAPPVVTIRTSLPLLDIGFFWCPGRVSWIYRGNYVGWVPLAPHEIYYSRRNWGGRHHRMVTDRDAISIDIRSYAYATRAVIVKQDNFYGVRDYGRVRVTNINPVIINQYHAAPVVNNTVIRNYTQNRQRYAFTDAAVTERPRETAVSRIRQNQTILRESGRATASELRQQTRNLKAGEVNRNVRIEAPRVTTTYIPADETTSRQTSGTTSRQRENAATGGSVPAVTSEGTGTTERRTGAVEQSGRTKSVPQNQQETPSVNTHRIVVPENRSGLRNTPQSDNSATPGRSIRENGSSTQSRRLSLPSTQEQSQQSITQPMSSPATTPTDNRLNRLNGQSGPGTRTTDQPVKVQQENPRATTRSTNTDSTETDTEETPASSYRPQRTTTGR